MNKRGQFFIIAAIIIISAISGLTGVANFAQTGEEPRAFYDLAEEVGFESKKVLDWGIFNKGDIDLLTKNFLSEYSNYIGGEEVIFIYGDKEGLNFEALVFKESGIGSVGLRTGEINRNIEINRNTGKTAEISLLTTGLDNKIIVNIEEVEYDFYLREGQNFFFVIIKDERNERFVARG